MIITVDLTDREAELLVELLNCQDFESVGFDTVEDMDNVVRACIKVIQAIAPTE